MTRMVLWELEVVNQFNECIKAEDYHKAKSIAEDLIKLMPASPLGHVLMASVLYESDADLEAGVRESDKALSIRPDHVGARMLKSFCLFRLKRFEESVEVLRPVIEKNPKNVPALFTIAMCYIMLSDAERAFEYANAASVVSPSETYFLCQDFYLNVVEPSRELPPPTKQAIFDSLEDFKRVALKTVKTKA